MENARIAVRSASGQGVKPSLEAKSDQTVFNLDELKFNNCVYMFETPLNETNLSAAYFKI
jgi:hypothetical protein